MLKRASHILLSVTIACLLLLNGVSHEFLHTFTGHEDTVDVVHAGHEQGKHFFESAHHHCDFLNLHSPVFITSSFHFSFFKTLVHYEYLVLRTQKGLSPEKGHISLRGPPVVAA